MIPLLFLIFFLRFAWFLYTVLTSYELSASLVVNVHAFWPAPEMYPIRKSYLLPIIYCPCVPLLPCPVPALSFQWLRCVYFCASNTFVIPSLIPRLLHCAPPNFRHLRCCPKLIPCELARSKAPGLQYLVHPINVCL